MIYVEKTGVVKLCDFGLARLMPFGMREIEPKHLGTGGTPAYQVPAPICLRLPCAMGRAYMPACVPLGVLLPASVRGSNCARVRVRLTWDTGDMGALLAPSDGAWSLRWCLVRAWVHLRVSPLLTSRERL